MPWAQLAGVVRLVQATRPWWILIEQTGSLLKASRHDARVAYESSGGGQGLHRRSGAAR